MATIAASTEGLVRELVPGVKALLDFAVRDATEACIQKAVTDFEKELRQAVAKAAISVSNYFSLEQHRGELVITVKLPTKEER